MKKSILIAISLLTISTCVSAQSPVTKVREFGVNLSGTQFGIRYKGGNESTLFRVTLSSLLANNNWYKTESGKSTVSNHGVGLNFGFEKRKSMSEKINLYIGSDILTSIVTGKNEFEPSNYSTSSLTLSTGIGMVLGVNFSITDRVSVSTEVVPSVRYSYSKTKNHSNLGDSESTNKILDYGLPTGGLNITLSFNLNKKNQE